MDDVGGSGEMCGATPYPSGGECPLCRGEAAPVFVEWVKMAAASPGERMTADEAMAWLGTL